jgi:hypothetical protein
MNIYDAIKERENQIAAFQAQIGGLQTEIEALRVAARILEAGNAVSDPARPVELARPVAVQVTRTVAGEKPKRVWTGI